MQSPRIQRTAPRRPIRVGISPSLGGWLLAFGLLTLFAAPPSSAQIEGEITYKAGPNDTLLARVGDREITMAYYRSEWNRLQPNELPQEPNPLRKRQVFLDDLVLRHVLAVETLKNPPPLLPGDQENLDGVRDHHMRQALYRKEIYDAATVDAIDIDLFVRELTEVLELRSFVFGTQAQAQAWYTKLVGGTPISRLVAMAQEDTAPLLRMEEPGFVIREVMSDTLARVLYSIPVGRISQPLEVNSEWYLYNIVSIRRRPPGVNLNDQEAVLAEARKFRAAEMRESYRQSLADSLEIQYDEVAMDTLLTRFLNIPDRMQYDSRGVQEFQVFVPMPVVSVEDSALVLATTMDRTITGRDVTLQVWNTSPAARSEIRTQEDLRAIIDRVAFDHALLARAWELGLDKDPSVLEPVQRRFEGFLVVEMYEDSVASKVNPTSAELEAYFDKNIDHFTRPPSAKIWMVMVNSQETADSVAQLARGGASLEELAQSYSTHTESADRGGISDMIFKGDTPNVDLDDAIFSTQLGEFGGPVQTQNGWVFFRVEEMNPLTVPRFDSEIIHVDRDYRRDAEAVIMEGFIERVQGRVGVTTYPEELKVLIQS